MAQADVEIKETPLIVFLRAAFPHLVCTFLILSICIFWPGMRSADSNNQLSEGISGYFDIFHPPIMAWWWSVLMKNIMPDSGVLLLFHLFLFWCAVYILGKTAEKFSLLWSYALLLLWFVPPIMGMTAVLWKDTGMVCCWLLATALIVRSILLQTHLHPLSHLIIFLLLFYGTAVRHNAYPAVFPLCVMWVYALGCRKISSIFCFSAIVFACLLGGTKWFEKQILTHPKPIELHLLNMEARALEWRTGEKLFPRSGITNYSDVFDPALYASDLHLAYDEFLAAILKYPHVYFRYRWERFKSLLRIGEKESCYPYHWNLENDKQSRAQKAVASYLDHSKNSFWYKGWLWLALPCILLIVAVPFYFRQRRPAFFCTICLTASSILMALPLFFIAPACDFRYLYWCLVATFLCVFVLLGDFLQRRKIRPSQPA